MTASSAAPGAPLPVVLAGARGHGRWHVDNIRRLAAQGLVRLAGICELTPLTEDEFGGELPAQSTDFGALLDSTGARAAVICTPIPTHTALAITAAERGVHLLLEKPPAPSYAAFRRMADGVAAAGVACQIGFQSLGSHAVPAIRELIAEGAVVQGSVLMPGVRVGRNAVVRNAILDKNVVVADDGQVGVDLAHDRERFQVSAGGVVCVGKNQPVE